MKTHLLAGAVLCLSCLGAVNASELSTLASNMKPGEWAELTTLGFDNGNLLYTTRNSPGDSVSTSNHIIDFAESAAWDPTTKQFMFLGAPHGNAWKFIIYDEATNSWREGPFSHPCMAYGGAIVTSDPNATYCGGHAFDWNAFDPASGRFFHTYWKFGPELDIYKPSTNQWSRSVTPPQAIGDLLGGYNYRYGAMEWFPEMNALLTLVEGKILRINVDTNTWEEWPTKYQMGGYHNVMEYSAAQKVVVFGGGNDWAETVAATPNSNDLYRMDADGTVTKLTNVPFYIRVTDQETGGHPGTIITADPVTGNFIILNKQKQFYELDAARNSWRQLTTVPPINSHAVAAPISNHGVIMYVTKNKVWLYKHSDPCLDCPVPTAPTGVTITVN